MDGNRYWYFDIGANRFGDNNPNNVPPDPRFRNNAIRTAKYTAISFLPLNFWHQVTKGLNLYYLATCVLQLIPAISHSGGKPLNLPPLIIIILISMIKDFIEDLRRRKADDEENDRKVNRLIAKSSNGTQYEEVKWKDLKTGEIVILKNKEFFPADLVMLRSSAPKNICYVETKSLDGETNLKEKLAPKVVFERFKTVAQLEEELRGTVKCEAPHDQIYRFEGVMDLADKTKISLTLDNFLLRGSRLKNTEWIYGVVTHTGHDTRIMRNSVNSKQK